MFFLKNFVTQFQPFRMGPGLVSLLGNSYPGGGPFFSPSDSCSTSEAFLEDTLEDCLEAAVLTAGALAAALPLAGALAAFFAAFSDPLAPALTLVTSGSSVLMFSASLMDDRTEPLSSSELLCDFLSLLLSLLLELRVSEGCLSVLLLLDVCGSTRSPEVDLCGCPFLTSFLLSTVVTTALVPWGVFPDTKSMFSCTSDFAYE